jgi:hypothetical protein
VAVLWVNVLGRNWKPDSLLEDTDGPSYDLEDADDLLPVVDSKSVSTCLQ